MRRIFASAADTSPRTRVLCGNGAISRDHELCHLASGTDAAFCWARLQTSAVDAVIDDGTLPASIAELATALGIPFARAAQRDIDSAAAGALAAARTFAEPA